MTEKRTCSKSDLAVGSKVLGVIGCPATQNLGIWGNQATIIHIYTSDHTGLPFFAEMKFEDDTFWGCHLDSICSGTEFELIR